MRFLAFAPSGAENHRFNKLERLMRIIPNRDRGGGKGFSLRSASDQFDQVSFSGQLEDSELAALPAATWTN